MSATDKEQHTDTEKATEKTESDRSSNSVNNALDVEAVLVPDLPEREETVGAGEADRGQSVGTSSDSTPPTTIEESQASQSLYFQNMFRTYAGNLEMFREANQDATASNIRSHPLIPELDLDHQAAIFERLPEQSSNPSGGGIGGQFVSNRPPCTCGTGELSSNNRHSCYSHPDQHVRDDLLLRSASFDTSAASISSMATIPDSVAYSIGSADESVDIISSDDHRSLYSPTGMSFDGASDYYSSDPECSAGVLGRRGEPPTATLFSTTVESDFDNSAMQRSIPGPSAANRAVGNSISNVNLLPSSLTLQFQPPTYYQEEEKTHQLSNFRSELTQNDEQQNVLFSSKVLGAAQFSTSLAKENDRNENESWRLLEPHTEKLLQSTTPIRPQPFQRTSSPLRNSPRIGTKAANKFKTNIESANDVSVHASPARQISTAQKPQTPQFTAAHSPFANYPISTKPHPPNPHLAGALPTTHDLFTTTTGSTEDNMLISNSRRTSEVFMDSCNITEFGPPGKTITDARAVMDIFDPGNRRRVANCPPVFNYSRDSTGNESLSLNQEQRNLSLYARLMQSYTVWYLPNLTRQDATDYLQNRQPGNFIVRHSSQPGTMALSLRSTAESEENLVEHFQIINTAEGLQINEAQNSFVDIVSLLQHYYENDNGLPCQLRLPRSIEKATGYELNQYWIMGEKFWIRSMNGELTDSGGSNSDEFTSDPAERATLERTIRTTSYNDDTESTARESSPAQLTPPPVPAKSQEIKKLIESECSRDPSAFNIQKRDKDFLARSSNLQHQISVSVSNDVSISSRRPPDLFSTGGAFGTTTEFNVNSPTGSVFQNSKTTPSDSGYDTSSKNVFEMNLQSSNLQHQQSQHRNQQLLIQQSVQSTSPHHPLSSVRSDPMLQPGDQFSASCPASAFSRSDSNATEHTSGCGGSGAQLTSSQISPNPTNPFTFPATDNSGSGVHSDGCASSSSSKPLHTHYPSNRLNNLNSMNNSSINGSLNVTGCSNILYQQYPSPINAQTSPFMENNFLLSKTCNSHQHAFSDDTSLSSGREELHVLQQSFVNFSSNNPFYNYAFQHQLSDNSAKDIIAGNNPTIAQSNWSTNGNLVPANQKCNSAENFQKSVTAPVSASSCESVHSANQSERSSTSSIFASKKVLLGLYEKGRNRLYEPPASGMSPNTFGNWISPTNDSFEYNTNFVSQIQNRSSTLPMRQRMVKKSPDNDSQEEHEDSKFWVDHGIDQNPTCNKRNAQASWKVPKVPRFWVNLRRKGKNSSNKIRSCIIELAQDQNTNFYRLVQNILDKVLREQDATNILSQVRQEMNSLKIYLTSPNEKILSDLIDRERLKMRENDFLNMDSITEDALHKIILKPLIQHLMTVLINHHKSNESLFRMERNLLAAKSKPYGELGIPDRLQPPQGKHLETVKHFFRRMTETFSPTHKLENLLAASKAIYISVEPSGGTLKPVSGFSMGAEEFLPMLIYCLVQFKFSTVEIEAEYIWKLLPPHIARGEAGYYLTALSVAAHILKNVPENTTLTSPVHESSDRDSPEGEGEGTLSAHGNTSTRGPRGDHKTGGNSSGIGSAGAIGKQGILSSPRLSPSTSTSANPLQRQGGSPVVGGRGSTSGGVGGIGQMLQSYSENSTQQLPNIADLEGFLKVVFPDEKTETIISKLLPVPPSMSAFDVCAMVAHKLKISHNPEDFGLYVVIEGERTKIDDNQCPQEVKAKLVVENKKHLFAYQRHTANILWAKTSNNSPPTTLNSTNSTSESPNQTSKSTTPKKITTALPHQHKTAAKTTPESAKISTGKAAASSEKYEKAATKRGFLKSSLSTPGVMSLQSSNFVALPPSNPNVTPSGGGTTGASLRLPFPSVRRARGGGSLSPQPRQTVDNQYVSSFNEDTHLSMSLPHSVRHGILSSPEPPSLSRSFNSGSGSKSRKGDHQVTTSRS